MIEAMACGTPVIAWRCGSVPEVVEPGVTGFVVGNIDEAVAAVQRVEALSRERIRRRFEQRFSAERMCNDYCTLYRSLMGEPAPAAKRISPVIHLPRAAVSGPSADTAA
jgi:glycosyltransferase involved in cell wall biosynthesis